MSPGGLRGRDLTSRLLAGVDQDVQRLIIAEGAIRKLRPGQVLCRMDEPAEHLYVLLKGRVQLSRPVRSGHEALVSVLAPGDVFGLVCLLTRRARYMGTAVATEAGEAMVWDRVTGQRLARDYPQLTANALMIAVAMVAQFAARHEALISASAPEGLARALSDLGLQSGTRSPDGIDIRIKNEQLAALADVSAFTASRQLQQWERAGAVQKRRGAVRIVDPDGLLPH
jgi:CRP/FNR family transcriptional regulator, cyclic AMP receptor protein